MGLFKRNTGNSIQSLEKRLDCILYDLPNTNDEITWADSLEGTLILGATGSGKSSGPGKHIAMAMLKAGFPILILCAKKDERQRWRAYAEKANRSDDVVIFDKDSNLQFNFLNYEMLRSGEGSGEIINAVNSLMNLNEQSRIFQMGSSGNREKFWDNALKRLLSRSIALLKILDEEISIGNIRRLVSDSLTSEDIKLYNHIRGIITTEEEIAEQKRKEAASELAAWGKQNYFVKLIQEIENEDRYDEDSRLIIKYWKSEFADLSERTRSIITESCLGLLEPFLVSGILKDQFSSGLSSELLPENIIKNKSIVIVDYAIKEYGLAGIYASSIYKMTFQSAMERRNVSHEENPTPVGLFIDEYQTFCNPTVDTLFQLTARSSWIATVYLTQNINNIKFVMGNNQPDARAKSLLNNLNLKFFASNSDYDSNRWASQMIGKHWQDFNTENYDKDKELTISKNFQLIDRFPPDEFTTLKTGRAINKFIVETVVFKAGKTWGDDQDNYTLVRFKQN